METNNTIKVMRVKIFQDTQENLSKANPMLLSGEWGMETDTGRLKIGDGMKEWLSLPYKIDRTLTKEMVDYIIMAKEYIEERKQRANGAN